MTPEASSSEDNPLFGNGITGLLDCALDSGLEVVEPEVPAHWEPPTPSHIAVLLPQYQIEHLIGRGGMGAVYKGKQITLQRPVAIKVLPAELARNAEFVARFHREAQLLASLSHQGIVTIFDFGQTTEGHLYFVMEYVDGTDLYRLIHKSKTRLEASEALSLTVQICEAMQYAHSKGVVHRDIKPANVLVTKDGRAKLADFGLAMKPADPDAVPQPPKPEVYFDAKHSPDVAAMRFTAPGAAMGTPDYAAPEVYEGKADERSDIYALGIMLYEMLTGAPPKGYFQLPSSMAPVDHRVDQVVVKALEIDPGARYQKVEEMKVDVQAATQPLAKPPPQPPTQVRVQPSAVLRPPARPSSVPMSTPRTLRSRILWTAALLALAGGGYLLWTGVQKHPEWLAFVKARVSRHLSEVVPAKPPQASPSVTSSSPAVTTPDPVLGRWWWPGDFIVTFTADGKFKRSDGAHGVWSCEPGKTLPCEYMLRWEGVNVDRLTLNKDASVLDGFIVNYRNARITAYRVLENPEPPPVSGNFTLESGFTLLLDKDHTTGWKHTGKGSMTNQGGTFITSTPPDDREPWGLYWFTSRQFTDFVLRFDFAVDTMSTNSGIFLGLSALNDGPLPLYPPGSMEIEIKGTDTGGIGGPAKVWKLPFTARKWHTMEIAVIGKTVTTQIDDNTIDTRILDRSLTGYIGLQNLGCCGSTYFRNVRIKELNVSPPAGAAVASPSATKTATAMPASVVTAPVKTSPVIPADAIEVQGRRYRYYSERVTWDEAKQRCEVLGGRLATIPNSGVWAAVRPLARQGAMWLGATDIEKEGQWKWIDGTPVQFTAWRSDQPDNWGAKENYLSTDEKGWIDVLAEGRTGVSTWVQGYLCEWVAPSSNLASTSVDSTRPPPGTPAITVFAYDLKALVAACLAATDDRSHDAKRALLPGYRDGLLKEGRNASASDLNAYRAALALCTQLLNVAAEREVASNASEWQSRASTLRTAVGAQVSAFQTTFEKTSLTKP